MHTTRAAYSANILGALPNCSAAQCVGAASVIGVSHTRNPSRVPSAWQAPTACGGDQSPPAGCLRGQPSPGNLTRIATDYVRPLSWAGLFCDANSAGGAQSTNLDSVCPGPSTHAGATVDKGPLSAGIHGKAELADFDADGDLDL
jgi:hypothetical protein